MEGNLEGTGLSANEVNQAIAKDVVTKNPGIKDGLINVGTYYPVQ